MWLRHARPTRVEEISFKVVARQMSEIATISPVGQLGFLPTVDMPLSVGRQRLGVTNVDDPFVWPRLPSGTSFFALAATCDLAGCHQVANICL